MDTTRLLGILHQLHREITELKTMVSGLKEEMGELRSVQVNFQVTEHQWSEEEESEEEGETESDSSDSAATAATWP